MIPVPPEVIFELLVDPRRHRDIDGSGTVRGARGEPQRLELGSQFGMSMKIGVPYAMVSTVIVFEENRRIAWQTRGPTAIGRLVAGRIWRYEIEPVEVAHWSASWDITQESAVTKPFAPWVQSRPGEHGRHTRTHRGADDYATGVNAHGMRLMPWMKLDCSMAGSPVISRSGSRPNSSSNMARISRRARFAPRQKCGPPPP